MSDQMPSGGIMGATSDPVKKNMSLFNPMDAAAIKESGEFQGMQNMTVRQAFDSFCQKVGIDPEGSATQLVEFAKSQVKNADMVGKMDSIARDSQGEEGAQPEAPPGLDSLMQGAQ
jgi:hypothetical protein